MTDLVETFADVSALIPRYSWEIMDEAQRDDLMANVVLPRYMQTTSDGVQLGPRAWAEMVGATVDAIRGRVQRLQASQMIEQDERAAPRWIDARGTRAAKQLLREAGPEALAEIIGSLPAERVEALATVTHERQMQTIRERGGSTSTLTKSDYETAREQIAKNVFTGWALITDMLVSIGRVRVTGLESIIAKATPAQRRELADRLPDEIALLQLALDLAKTTKLAAVR